MIIEESISPLKKSRIWAFFWFALRQFWKFKSWIFSTFPNSGSRCPILLFKVTFGILISSPSLLEHFQALSRSHKRTIRGGGRGTSLGNLDIFGFFQMLLRHLWKGPWWFCLIQKLSLMLHLVVWECLGLTLSDMKHLPFDRFATDSQNPTFTFLWDNDRLVKFHFPLFHVFKQYCNIVILQWNVSVYVTF